MTSNLNGIMSLVRAVVGVSRSGKQFVHLSWFVGFYEKFVQVQSQCN